MCWSVLYDVIIVTMTCGHGNNNDRLCTVLFVLYFTLFDRGGLRDFHHCQCVLLSWSKIYLQLGYTRMHAHASIVHDVSFMVPCYVERLPRCRVWYWEGWQMGWCRFLTFFFHREQYIFYFLRVYIYFACIYYIFYSNIKNIAIFTQM